MHGLCLCVVLIHAVNAVNLFKNKKSLASS